MSFSVLVMGIGIVLIGACTWLVYVLIDGWLSRRRAREQLRETFVKRYGRNEGQ